MIAASIVSHGHGNMVVNLIKQLLSCEEISKIIVTFNVPEPVGSFPSNSKIIYIKNKSKKGYGANHNNAFDSVNEKLFCVLNPDVELIGNPFPSLLKCYEKYKVSLVAPLIISKSGKIEDSMRITPTFQNLFRKLIFGCNGKYQFDSNDSVIFPDWVAGMFMLFDSEKYKEILGFDESFYMYYEDVDICDRIWFSGGKIAGDLKSIAIHDARRASHKNLLHMRWHLMSMMRYLRRKH